MSISPEQPLILYSLRQGWPGQDRACTQYARTAQRQHRSHAACVGGIGSLLQHHRKAAGLSQEELAERAEMSRRGISDLERGLRRTPYPDTVRRLAQALGLSQPEYRALIMAGLGQAAVTEAPRAEFVLASARLALTSLVGRELELHAARLLLNTSRLLTLTGTGGVGKTRLALALLYEMRTDSQADIAFIDFAPLVDPDLVPQTVASALGVREQPGRSVVATLIKVIQSKSLLLVLDNCEHLIHACATLAEDLLGACPNLRILATSREPMGLGGEVVSQVLPLSLPEVDMSPAQIECSGAAQLFLERARTALPELDLNRDDLRAVAVICRRLEGVPLAIELAASRIRVLSVEQIAERLGESFGLLANNRRLTPVRHTTLRASIDWSHDPLSAAERAVFRRLAVFARGGSLEAAEAICSDQSIAPGQVLDLLALLVDKSLVFVERSGSATRYRLLEPIRDYALEKLGEADELAVQRACHATWFLSLAEWVAPQLAGREEVGSLDRVETEHDNLRTALGWFVQQHQGEAALRLAVALSRFWHRRGHFLEGCRWLESALAVGAEESAYLRGMGLNALAQLLWSRDDFAEAERRAEEAHRVCAEAGDTRGLALALTNWGLATFLRGESGRAVTFLEESLRAARLGVDRSLTGLALRSLGRALLWANGPDEPRVVMLVRESLALARQDGSRHAAGMALTTLGDRAWRRGQVHEAASLWGQALEVRSELADRWAMVTSLGRLALAATAKEPPELAARLLGAAHEQRQVVGVSLRHDEGRDVEAGTAATRARLVGTDFAAAWAAGEAMSLEAALAEARSVLQQGTSSKTRVS